MSLWRLVSYKKTSYYVWHEWGHDYMSHRNHYNLVVLFCRFVLSCVVVFIFFVFIFVVIFKVFKVLSSRSYSYYSIIVFVVVFIFYLFFFVCFRETLPLCEQERAKKRERAIKFNQKSSQREKNWESSSAKRVRLYRFDSGLVFWGDELVWRMLRWLCTYIVLNIFNVLDFWGMLELEQAKARRFGKTVMALPFWG